MKKTLAASYKIGKFQLGWRMVDLFVEPAETGGWFNCCAGGENAQIHIGLDYPAMHKVFEVMSHEAMELAMCDEGCSFKRNDAFVPNATDCYHFIMHHNQFTEAVARAGFFLFHSLPLVTKEWEAVRKIKAKG